MTLLIRGKKFCSVEKIAQHFSLTKKHVREQLRLGRANKIGIGSGNRGVPIAKSAAMSIEVRGKYFGNAHEAATYFNLSVATVYSAVARGRTHTLGLGKGKIKENYKGGKAPVKIKLGGETFPSIASLARRVNKTRGSVRHALRVGGKAKENLLIILFQQLATKENQVMKQAEKELSS